MRRRMIITVGSRDSEVKIYTRRFYCPCHEGPFSAEDGRVLARPPPKPLPRHPVEIRGGEVWVKPA